MPSIAHVGLDVHKETTRAVILPHDEPHPVDECTVATTQQALVQYLRRWAQVFDLHCYYEAGPCGYEPKRWLAGAGIACDVIAPSKTPRAPGERVITDKRAARTLAYQGRAQALARVQVPTPEQEAVRAAVRCREVRVRDLVAAKHRVLKLWRNRGHVFREGKQHWTQLHWRWLRRRDFEGPDEWTAQQYLSDVQYRQDRLAEADRVIAELAEQEPYRSMVGKLCCFRGIDVLSAMVLITETLDFRRFPGAPQFMGYWGLTSSEDSTGRYRRQGAITKAGSARARRVWIEAAWHYQHRPALGAALYRRQRGQPPQVIAHAWKAQQHLYRKFWNIASRKDKRIAVVAVARELAGFVWAAMTQFECE